MKKKLACLLMMLVVCVSVFSGCNLFKRDLKSYYEATVATIKYKDGSRVDTVTKRELLMAYQSYGQNYVDNYGYSKKKAVQETLETVINNKIKIKYVEDYYAEKNKDGSLKHGELLNVAEKTYLWDNTFQSVSDMMKDYFYEVTKIKEPTASEDDSQSGSVEQKFVSPTYFGVDEKGNTVIKLYESEESLRDSYVVTTPRDYEKTEDGGKKPDKEVMYKKLLEPIGDKQTTSEKNWGKAFDKYIDEIKNNYSYIDFKDDEEIFKFELDRVYNILKENYMVEKYEDIFTSNSNLSPITAEEVLKSYTQKVNADYTKYKIKKNNSGFESDMLSNPGDVDYILEGNGASKFFYVGFVKMTFDEKLQARYQTLKDSVEDKSFYGDYDTELNDIYNSVTATERDRKTGEKTENKVGAQALLTQIKNAVKGEYLTEGAVGQDGEKLSQNEITDLNNNLAQIKADAFKEYLYYYNDDDSLKNADYNTTFGFNSQGEILASDTFNTDEIKDAIKKLYDGGNAKIGDVSDLVRADDGLYIFFFAGNATNPISVTENFDATLQPEENLRKLANTKLNIFSDKTLFDKLYSELGSDLLSPFLNEHIIMLREKTTRKIIENNIKDLY